MTKDLLLRLPEEVYDVLVYMKEHFAVNISDQIRSYLCRGLVSDGLVDIPQKISAVYREDITIPNPMPEGVKFCDGDSCELDFSQATVDGKRIVVGMQ